MSDAKLRAWFVQDRRGRNVYLTRERWQHALDHPGMREGLLDAVLTTIRQGCRRQDRFDPSIYKYSYRFDALPGNYTHFVVVVKFGWRRDDPYLENNFVLTAYLIEKISE